MDLRNFEQQSATSENNAYHFNGKVETLEEIIASGATSVVTTKRIEVPMPQQIHGEGTVNDDLSNGVELWGVNESHYDQQDSSVMEPCFQKVEGTLQMVPKIDIEIVN